MSTLCDTKQTMQIEAGHTNAGMLIPDTCMSARSLYCSLNRASSKTKPGATGAMSTDNGENYPVPARGQQMIQLLPKSSRGRRAYHPSRKRDWESQRGIRGRKTRRC